jgi:hypothetical protein
MSDGHEFRASVARKIKDDDAANHQHVKSLVKRSDGELDEVIAFNQLSNIIKDQHNKELHEPNTATWSFKAINNHQGPLNSSGRHRKGHNVLVHWEDGSETCKPLTVMAKATPPDLCSPCQNS